MITRVLVLAKVLAITLAVTTPALAQPDIETAKPIPGYPFEITDKGQLVEGGDVIVGKCGSTQDFAFRSKSLDKKAARACEKAGFSMPGPGETTMVNGSPIPVPPSGGPAILLPAAALLLGSGILIYVILRRR
jgi:hypothetical protein